MAGLFFVRDVAALRCSPYAPRIFRLSTAITHGGKEGSSEAYCEGCEKQLFKDPAQP